ncbi:MAG: HAD-IA family hydrolase [Sulfitobacter sp.]
MSICLMLDVDGVLVSGRPSDGQIWTHELFDDLGVNPKLLVEDFFAREWQDVVTGKQDLRPVLEDSLNRLGTNVSVEELISYWFKMDSRINQQVLEDCRVARTYGCQIYLTTNQDHRRAQYLMTEMGLENEVDGIAYSAEAGFQKPSPSFYSYAADKTGRQPSEMLLVDDTLANIHGAIHAGWEAVHWDENLRLLDILQYNIGR